MNGLYQHPSMDGPHHPMQGQGQGQLVYPYSYSQPHPQPPPPPHPQYVQGHPQIWGYPQSIAYPPPHAPILAHRPPTYHQAPIGVGASYYPYLSSSLHPPPPQPQSVPQQQPPYFPSGPVLAPIRSAPVPQQSRYAFASNSTTGNGGGSNYGPIGLHLREGPSRDSSSDRSSTKVREDSMHEVLWAHSTSTEKSNLMNSVDHYDHPSFDRPPHKNGSALSSRSTSRDPNRPSLSTSATGPTAGLTDIAAIDPTTVTYDLIPPNVSAVPPPPPIEKSAVPLADLATEMVWEAVALALSSTTFSSSSTLSSREENSDEVVYGGRGRESRDRSLSSSGGRDEPRTPEPLFGAIGEKRSMAGGRSTWSSPNTSMPGTPAAGQSIGFGSGLGYETGYDWRGRMKWSTEEKEKDDVEMCGLGFGDFKDDEVVRVSRGAGADVGRRMEDSPIPDQHRPSHSHPHSLALHQLRRQQSSSRSRSSPTSVPTVAFRQFVKSVLTATLISPEDLILALYYVARIPTASIIQPPPVEQRMSVSARANAVKAAPFKVFLGALMLANKSLQDNSYRNETFSTVSGIPLKDVNDLELFVYAALDFNTTVQSSLWSTWLSVVGERMRAKKGDIGERCDVERALMGLKKALKNFCEEVEEKENGTRGERQATPDSVIVPIFGLSTPPSTPERKSVSSGSLGVRGDSCAVGWNGHYPSMSTSSAAYQHHQYHRPTSHYPHQQHQPQQQHPLFDSPSHSRSMWMNYPVSQTRVFA